MNHDTKESLLTQLSIKPLEERDIADLIPILIESVVDSETQKPVISEIREIESYMRGSADDEGRQRSYLVARNFIGEAVGCMAIAEPDNDMLEHFTTTSGESDELLNAFIAKSSRGMGVGKQLLNNIKELSKSRGKKYLIIHSGPRYEETAWGFYDKQASDSGFIKNKYGPGRDAKTWKVTL